ncbi:MAG: hypothetical protein GY816_24525 [Cytophagales bacterium]|nr:hypothetical protein [Cytophagales bacterium]
MKKIILIALVLASIPSTAQNVELSDNQLNINILPLTFSYERKIDDNKSFTLGGGIVSLTNSSGYNVDGKKGGLV